MPLGNPLTNRIYEHVNANPGLTYTQIAKALALEENIVDQHVQNMIKDGFVYIQDDQVHPKHWAELKDEIFPETQTA